MTEHRRRPIQNLVRRSPSLTEDMTIAEAAERIVAAGNGLPVVDRDGRLVGYLGERALLKAIIPGYLHELRDTDFLTRDLTTLSRFVARAAASPISEHMSPKPAFVDVEDSEMHAAELFLHRGVRSLAVLDTDGAVLGVLRLGDLIADLMGVARGEDGERGP